MGEGSAETEISTMKRVNIKIIHKTFTINNISDTTKALLKTNIIPMVWL